MAPEVAIRYRSDLHTNGVGLRVTLDGERWFVGELALRQSEEPLAPRTRRRSEAFERVLMVSAMHGLDVRDEAAMVAGRPVAWYDDRDELAQTLQGYHRATINGEVYALQVRDVQVVPQPFGSFFSVILDEAGVLIDPDGLRDGRVAVLDVGMFTSDYAFSDALHYVEERSGSIPYAMSKVYELTQRWIEEEHGRALSLRDAEETVRRGWFRDRGERVDAGEIVGAAIAQVCKRIVGEAQTLWSEGRDIDALFVTGGGAAVVFGAVQERFSQAQMLDAPQTANARGFLRYARRQFG
jgi:plasmid segregation protein ParM